MHKHTHTHVRLPCEPTMPMGFHCIQISILEKWFIPLDLKDKLSLTIDLDCRNLIIASQFILAGARTQKKRKMNKQYDLFALQSQYWVKDSDSYLNVAFDRPFSCSSCGISSVRKFVDEDQRCWVNSIIQKRDILLFNSIWNTIVGSRKTNSVITVSHWTKCSILELQWLEKCQNTNWKKIWWKFDKEFYGPAVLKLFPSFPPTQSGSSPNSRKFYSYSLLNAKTLTPQKINLWKVAVVSICSYFEIEFFNFVWTRHSQLVWARLCRLLTDKGWISE